MTLLARKPQIDFSQAPVIWTRVPEFAFHWNGSSVVTPYVEHFLNNVMNEVRSGHCADRPALKREIDEFIRQESTHARYHITFNKRLIEEGYSGVTVVVDRMIKDLQTIRETRSLTFCVAYCAGFENIATFLARYIFEECDELLDGADPRGANLLLWHVAEEFEHRSVCHEALKAVGGGYFRRVWGVLYAFRHVYGSFNRATDALLGKYRMTLTEAERAASARQQARLNRRLLAYALPRLALLMLPNFDPSRFAVPVRIRQALVFFASGGPIERSVMEVFSGATASGPAG